MICVLVSWEILNKFRTFFITSMIIPSLPNQFHINLPTLRINARGYSEISASFYSDTQFHSLGGGKYLAKFIISFGVGMTTTSEFFRM